MPQRVSRGRLSFQRSGEVTAVDAAYADTPLRLLTPRNHGRAAWAYTSTLGGGLVDGDRLHLELALGPRAEAFVTTQGPTRVYRSASGCESELRARVGPEALLVLAPDPVCCFAGANYQQRTLLELDPTASLAAWELLAAGRIAHGERWAFARYRSALEVQRAGVCLLDDALLLDHAHGPLTQEMGRFECLATLLLVGSRFAPTRASIQTAIDAAPIAPGAALVAAASPLGSDGLLVRFAARSPEALQQALREHLAIVPSLLGDDPWARRN